MSSNDVVIEIENMETITLDKEIERGSSSHEPIGDEFLSKATSDETSSSSSQEIPSNTMAYFVATSIGFKDGGGDITKSNMLRAIAVAGPSMVWCLFIQIVFLIALMNYIDGTDPKPSNSTSVVTLQICSISLFLVDICNTLRDLLVQAMIIFSKEYIYKETKYAIKIPMCKRLLIFCMTTVTEICIFGFCCFVSVKYLLSAHDVETIILNTLAIGFIMQIDEIFFQSLVPEAVINTVKKITVSLKYFPNSDHSKNMNKVQKLQQLYMMFFHLPTCVVISFLSVWFFNGFSVIQDPFQLLGNNSTNLSSEYIHMSGIESVIIFVSAIFISVVCLAVYKYKKNKSRKSSLPVHPENSK